MVNSRLKKLTTKQLWEEFRRLEGLAEEYLREFADVWVELIDRGENLAKYTNPMFSFLPDVATGKLLPNLLWKYGNNVSLMKTISSLVPEEQEKISSASATIPVVTSDGKIRNIRPSEMRVKDLKRVIQDGRILSPKEQVKNAPKQAPPERAPRPRGEFNLEAHLADYQIEQLRKGAKAEGVSVAEFIVVCLIEVGAINAEAPTASTSPRRSASSGVERPQAHA